MNEREEAFEVAKLAAMVGGQMNLVDRMTTERMSAPANKINIHDFINKVKNPNASFPVYAPPTPAGFAPPIDERTIQSMVPDAQPTYNPNVATSESAPVVQQPIVAPAPVENKQSKVKLNKPSSTPIPQLEPIVDGSFKPVLSRSDVDSIRNSLKSIDKTLAGMLKFLQESGKPKANE